jgi:hypothetical protein
MRAGRRSFDWRTPRVIVALAAVAVLVLAVPAWADMLESDDGPRPFGPATAEGPGEMPAPEMAVPAQPPSGSPPDGSRYVIPAPPPPGPSEAVPLPGHGEVPAPQRP